jgi:hypothetical protein
MANRNPACPSVSVGTLRHRNGTDHARRWKMDMIDAYPGLAELLGLAIPPGHDPRPNPCFLIIKYPLKLEGRDRESSTCVASAPSLRL